MKSVSRKSIVLLSLIVTACLLIGCSNNSDDTERGDLGSTQTIEDGGSGSVHLIDFMSPDFVFVSEVIPFPLPDGKATVGSVAQANNIVYFTARGDGDVTVDGLFVMDADGTNFEKLPNYIPGSLPPDETNKFVSIHALHVDSEGYLWIVEFRYLQGAPVRDGLGESIVRKLDNTGAEILKFDLSLALNREWVFVQAFIVDDSENIYIASETSIYILDNQGSLLFSLDNQDFLAKFLLLPDGSVAFVSPSRQQTIGTTLVRIDIESRSWGEITTLPSDIPGIHSVFSSMYQFLYLYNNSTHLIGVVNETGEHIELLSWVDSALSSVDITGIMFLPYGRLSVTRHPQFFEGEILASTELLLLTKTARDELPDRIVLTLATFDFRSDLRYAVEMFNNNSNTHRIDVIDYSQFDMGGDSGAGIRRLHTEIISGNSPDILDMRNMPLKSYASIGLLVDLYPFLDTDLELSGGNLIESVFKASEIDGSLYSIIPSFEISTITGHPSVLGSNPGWNFDEFIAVLDANPEADLPLGAYTSKMSIFSILFSNFLDEYVDFATGTVFFDSDSFIGLLEFANTFPSEVVPDNTAPFFQLIASGRQIMHKGSFGGVSTIAMFRTVFGGELIFKGFPAENRDGNAFIPTTNIAITTNSADPNAAWEFVRLFLLEHYQRYIIPSWQFPVSRLVFEERLSDAMNLDLNVGMSIGDAHGMLTLDSEDMTLSQKEADMLGNLIDNITRVSGHDDALWTIVRESAEDFFNGSITAQDAARIIQSRAALYLAEQQR